MSNNHNHNSEHSTSHRYEALKTKSGLRYAIMEVTSKCQLACPGCYMIETNKLNSSTVLSLEQAVNILDICKQYTGEELSSVDILGGEPLLWPHLKEFISVLLSRGIKPWIFTNMITVTDDLASWLHSHKVNVTGKLNIDPRDKSQYELQAAMLGAKKVTVTKLLKSIEIFKNAGYKYPLFRLQNLIRKDNIQFVPGYYDYCLDNDFGTDLELMASGEGVCDAYYEIAPSREQLAEMIKKIQSLRTQRGLKEKEVLMPHIFGSCPFFDSGLYFSADGSIRACSNSNVNLAHTKNEHCIRNAFESDLMCNRLILSKENVKEPCSSCDSWSKCRGGCRATAEASGDPFAGYELCPVPLLKDGSGDKAGASSDSNCNFMNGGSSGGDVRVSSPADRQVEISLNDLHARYPSRKSPDRNPAQSEALAE